MVLSYACERLIEEQPDFWTLAGLTERSFEVGSAPKFSESLAHYRAAGVSEQLATTLAAGINRSLARMVEQCAPSVGAVRYNAANKGVIPDLCFGPVGERSETIAEVKLVYDFTGADWYGEKGVTGDASKLRAMRREGFVGHLIQIVFFVQLPGLEYPAGDWYPPTWASWRSRTEMLRRCFPGIPAQYARLRRHMTAAPAWPPGDAPHVQSLPKPSPELSATIERFYGRVFRPSCPWRFDASAHLADAAVGVAIWKH